MRLHRTSKLELPLGRMMLKPDKPNVHGPPPIGRLIVSAGVFSLGLVMAACSSRHDVPAAVLAEIQPAPRPPEPQALTPRDYPGIHNAVTFVPGLVSGAVPEGDAGFETLAAMGVKTVISVDGAAPEVDRATARGLRYIHLPIGYNGFDEERRLQLARAARDAMANGPIYIHCHHGKHRSAAAAAAIAANLGLAAPATMVDRMKVSGTAPAYQGLYACAENSSPLPASVVDSVPAEFPAVWTTSDFVQGMVEIDHAFDHLKILSANGWKAPADHPDLVPAAEAGRLAELHRALIESPRVREATPEFAQWMDDGRRRASELENLLAAPTVDAANATRQFALVVASCRQCHAKYRDQ